MIHRASHNMAANSFGSMLHETISDGSKWFVRCERRCDRKENTCLSDLLDTAFNITDISFECKGFYRCSLIALITARCEESQLTRVVGKLWIGHHKVLLLTSSVYAQQDVITKRSERRKEIPGCNQHTGRHPNTGAVANPPQSSSWKTGGTLAQKFEERWSIWNEYWDKHFQLELETHLTSLIDTALDWQ